MSKKELKRRLMVAHTELSGLFPHVTPSKKELASAINILAVKHEINYNSLFSKYQRAREGRERGHGNCLLTNSQEAQIAGAILHLDILGEPVTRKIVHNNTYIFVRRSLNRCRSFRWLGVS